MKISSPYTQPDELPAGEMLADQPPLQVAAQKKPADMQSPEDTQRLLHELQVHQVELAMQNEEIMTARLEVEAALERYAEFYDFAPVGYLSLDRDGIIRTANLTAATMLGIERGRLAGRHLESLVAEGGARVRATVHNVFEQQGREVCDVRLQHGGQVVYARIEATTSRSGQECRAVLIDMTEQRHAEEEIRQLNDRLERRVQERTAELESALKEQESFSYTVSHDLRAPLRNINGHLNILKEEFPGDIPEHLLGHVERVCELTCHMGELIDQLLNLARIVRCEVVREKLDVSAMASAVVSLLREAEPERDVDCVIDPSILMHADRTLIWLVLKNLIENAWKYTSAVAKARIEVKGVLRGGKYVVQVKDNGVGFDMAYRDQLFGTFQRLHGQEYRGLGIGLATVKRIVERHGGEVWGESEVNGGATFYFTVA